MAESVIPLLLSLLVGFVLGVVTWGALRLAHRTDNAPATNQDHALLGFLALAAFALGAFLTYALMGFRI